MTRAHLHRLRAQASARTRDLNLAGRRAEWRELADRAKSAASLAGAALDRDIPLHLSHLQARLAKAAPPLEGLPDRLVAEALRLVCEAWAARSPERREALNPALGALAQLVDQLLTDDQVRAAEVWQRQSGGRD